MTAMLRRIAAWSVPRMWIAPKAVDRYWHIEGVNCSAWCRAKRHGNWAH